jgi:hypothetical protein
MSRKERPHLDENEQEPQRTSSDFIWLAILVMGLILTAVWITGVVALAGFNCSAGWGSRASCLDALTKLPAATVIR